MKNNKFLLSIVLISIGLISIKNRAQPPLPVLTTCKITKNGLEFGTRAKDCSPEEQKKACDNHAGEPQLGPSIPVKCTPFTSIDKLSEALTAAAKGRINPIATVTPPAAVTTTPTILPIGITCTLKNPKGSLKSFVGLIASPCDKERAQKKCEFYNDVPHLGPSDFSGECTTFQTVKERDDWLMLHSKTGGYPGAGGAVITCKTRDQGIEYNQPTEFDRKFSTCSDAAAQRVCQTTEGIAGPLPGCKIFKTNLEFQNELAKKPMLYGLECQFKVGGFGKRAVVPDCGQTVKNDACPPADLDVLSCTKFSDAQSALNWSKILFNRGLVSCSVNISPSTIVEIPTLDCNNESKKRACGQNMTALGCIIADAEKLKQMALAKKGAQK